MLAAFTMPTPKVWCLTIDHENKPIGGLFKVNGEGDIIDLKEKVKENRSTWKDVNANQLVVWRCKETQELDDADREQLELRVRAVFFDNKVTKLGERQTIEELKLSDEEILLVQVPGTFPLSPSIPPFSSNPLSYQYLTSPVASRGSPI